MRVRATSRGARLVEDGAVISEVLRRPGPTQSVFDVLAAAAVVLGEGPRLALLGFAAGGIVAPLRALGHRGRIEGVDRSRDGWSVFTRLCAPWCGAVRLRQADAAAWLAGRRGRLGTVVEDLSVRGPEGVTKPAVSIERLPAMIAERLAPRGVAIVNLLPVPGLAARALETAAGRAYRDVRVVHLAEFENRVLIGARRRLPPARGLGGDLRRALVGLGSTLAAGISVRGAPR